MNRTQTDRITIEAGDGFPLAASVFVPDRPTGRSVVLNSATAVPRGFYRRFATHLSGRGYSVVTYDYRGIGESRPASLRGFDAVTRQWGLVDMPAVVRWARSELADGPVFLVGHSVGGQVAGLVDNPHDVAAMVTFSSQSGHWRLQGGIQKALVALYTHVTLPMLSHLVGYAPWSWFSSAEDLPKGVALEWSRWCRHRDYLLGDASLPLERYRAFRAPVLAYSFSDDAWGTARSVDAMMAAYPNVERRHVTPAQLGLAELGHMGAFRPTAARLWDQTIDWLDAH